MQSVTIGIYLDGDVRRLDATLAGLAKHTATPFELLLLPDAIGDDAASSLAGRGILITSPNERPSGAAAWFNRLATCTSTDVIVFLEAGAVPGPRWLELLLAALGADPANGLAGPSTNSAWNEQGALHGGGSSLSEVAATARGAAQRFGNSCRTFEPLHSLSDFCYAVKRQVIDAVGGADEAYGLGPCWEMDYNIRAARCGYRGVWASGAFVYRAPFSARRAREEPLHMETARHRYQDKFCGLRLRGEAIPYEPHCKGDACEHFAPAAHIQIRLPPPARALTPLPAATLLPHLDTAHPLVTCVMVTGNRREFALQSIGYFERQDYPNRELVIVDDGPDDLSAEVAANPRIRYARVPRGMTIGGKRNHACQLAKGAIIAQWDDDDWYAPGRLTAQIRPILAGQADITGFHQSVFFDLPNWRFWTCTDQLHRRLFFEDVHGGTLVFRREICEQDRYPNSSLAEDAALLRAAMRRGRRLHRISASGLFVYLRHGGNAWSFECGRYLDPRGWLSIDPPNLCGDAGFYAARSNASPATTLRQPLVTCIMPTANRRAFVPQAIQFFQRQTYSAKELLILDDGRDTVADLVPEDPAIRYVRLDARQPLGRKRNQACEMARGDVIAHWDDDDWMSEWRLEYQVAALTSASQPSATGLSRVYFCHRFGNRAWLYLYPDSGRPWIHGGTMCYHKALWEKYRFPEIDEGEDTRFVWALPAATVIPLSDNRFYVGTVHDANTSPKRVNDSRWQSLAPAEIRHLIGNDWDSFIAVDR